MSYPTTISFRWNYSTADRTQFDQPKYRINDAEAVMPGFSTKNGNIQSGKAGPFTLQPGDTFAFVVWSQDGRGGSGYTTISEFQAYEETGAVRVPFAKYGFNGLYAPSTWVVTSDQGSNGYVKVFDDSVAQLVSSTLEGAGLSVWVTHAIPVRSIISFDWTYSTPDRPEYDQPKVALDGVQQALPNFDPCGAQSQSGHYAALLLPNQLFSLVAWSLDGKLFPCTFTVTNWKVETALA
jgi:hypothetical protein